MYSADPFASPRRGRWLGSFFTVLIIAGLVGGAVWWLRGGGDADPDATGPTDGDGLQAPEDAPASADLILPEGARELAGTRLYRQGQFTDAEAELESHLAMDGAEESLQAKYVLALARAKSGAPEEAYGELKTITEENRSSPYAASALVAMAAIEKVRDQKDLAASHLDRAWMSHGGTTGGQRAGLLRGDELYVEFAIPGREVHAEWERIRDAYSVALPSLRGKAGRVRIIERLDRINDYLIFNPRTEFGAAVAITVEPGDTISHIAERHGSTAGIIMRINKLSSTVIHPGKRLKIVGGKLHILVDKRYLRLTLTLDGKLLRDWPVGIGRSDETPAGTFSIGSQVENPDWYRRGKPKVPFGDPRNILGTRWLGFRQSGAGMGIGIHGSKDGEGVGKRQSAGCIRMHNDDVNELYDYVPRGTRVTIIE